MPLIHPSKLATRSKIAKGSQAKLFLAKYLKEEKDVIIRTYRGCGVDTNDLLKKMEKVMESFKKSNSRL
jgi:hypothetical protein